MNRQKVDEIIKSAAEEALKSGNPTWASGKKHFAKHMASPLNFHRYENNTKCEIWRIQFSHN